MSRDKILEGTASQERRLEPCMHPDCKDPAASNRCRSCAKPVCNKHAWHNSGVAASGLYCAPCSRKAFEDAYAEVVTKMCHMAFGLGLVGITLHTPDGNSVYQSVTEATGIVKA